MTSDRHARIKAIFLEAVASPPEDWPAVLDRRCGDDKELRREIEKLLAHHDERTITPSAEDPTISGSDTPDTSPRPVLGDAETVGFNEARTTHAKDAPLRDLTPGFLVADRYRIVARLGQGGMGVVYRAEDLTLGQTVAIKFLNPAMAGNADWLARFRNEVRLAREVTNANVCRVYDIAEVDGRHFLTMEYVDGEDLSSLTKRIGRLPREKAIDVARQLCVGLAAAHAAGILHRDLKPANVMLDGRGQVRITDFGLAASPQSVKGLEVRAGTPAYMAPEQICGLEVSVQSDIYSLGLVMYELFSGRQAFEADTVAEYVELHRVSEATPLSQIVEDADPQVEHVIEWCLRKHPSDRPSSALAVAAALPGTDPLSVAMAANLTPSPETVAAARPKRCCSVGATYLLLIAIVLIAGLAITRSYAPVSWKRASTKPPAVLAERARELVAKSGFTTAFRDQAYGFCSGDAAMAVVTGRPGGETVQGVLAGAAASGLVFWYRQSSDTLVPSHIENVVFGPGRVTPTDPSPLVLGSVSVVLDLSGRLLLFTARPVPDKGSIDVSTDDVARNLWQPFLNLAGVKRADLRIMETSGSAPVQADRQFTWLAPDPRNPRETVRVDACSSKGKSVYFAVRDRDLTSIERSDLDDMRRREKLQEGWLRSLYLAMIVIVLPLAVRNFRAGRSDRGGAVRLALFVGVLQLVVWLLQARHIPDFSEELLRVCLAVIKALGTATLAALFYTALEPYARRHWPQMLIAWSRVVSGRTRDPVVGEHLLIGVCVGSFWALVVAGERALVSVLGWTLRYSILGDRFGDKLLSAPATFASYLDAVHVAIGKALLCLLLLACLRSWLRRPGLAAVLAAILLLPLILPMGANIWTMWLFMGVGVAGVAVWLMTRFGLLALSTAIFVAFVLNTSPITLDFTQWYAEVTFYALSVVIAVAMFGYSATRTRSDAV